MRFSFLFALFILPAISLSARPQLTPNRVVQDLVETEAATFRVVQVAEGLDHPWSLAFLPNGDFLVTERMGRLWRVSPRGFHQIGGLPVVQQIGQGGLMDVILHPDFERTRRIFFSYSSEYDGGVGTRVARATLENDQLRDFRVIFSMNPPGRGRVHFGSRLAFDASGLLYITIGERGDRNRSQQLDSHHGKVIRLREDGSIPRDNPFVDTPGARPEIYSYGHRNQQGLVIDPRDGTIWTHEHGPRGGDTLNIILPGRNYGWPIATHGEEYRGGTIGTVPEALPEVTDPLLVWKPVSIAPCGLALYLGDRFPGWQGDLFIGALVQQHIHRVVLENNQPIHQERILQGQLGRIREVRQHPDGTLWVTTDAGNGGIFRLEPIAD